MLWTFVYIGQTELSKTNGEHILWDVLDICKLCQGDFQDDASY